MDEVLGVLQGAEDAVAVHLQFSPVRFDELAERVAVARPGAGEHGVGHVATSSSPLFVAITRVGTGGRRNEPLGPSRRP